MFYIHAKRNKYKYLFAALVVIVGPFWLKLRWYRVPEWPSIHSGYICSSSINRSEMSLKTLDLIKKDLRYFFYDPRWIVTSVNADKTRSLPDSYIELHFSRGDVKSVRLGVSPKESGYNYTLSSIRLTTGDASQTAYSPFLSIAEKISDLLRSDYGNILGEKKAE